ncbi:MAG: hypothetical protein AUG89_03430 [Acidobacteria bacterium 13_1_20CM_4_56_7]|nr:MAG: hypothetical protein AUG89_03430 [Acidobacteria bacterium 13_1_20CM_4_56_7]
MENVIVSEENKKPPHDEQTLAKLLEAAYVLQEHSDELRALEAQLGLTRSQEPRSGNVPDFESHPDQNPAPHQSPASNQKSSSMAGIMTDALSREPKFLDATAELSALVAQLSQQDPGEQLESATSVRCYKCGHELVAGEQFCGQCGAARSEDGEPASMQSKLASLWHLKLSSQTDDDQNEDQLSDPAAVAAEVPINLRALQQAVASTPDPAPESQHNSEIVTHLQPTQNALEVAGETESASAADWSSAESARDYLQQVAGNPRRTWLAAFWNDHRGDLYLAVAVLVVLVVLRFGLWSNRSVTAIRKPATATSSVHKPAARELPLADRILIQLGLAEPPPVPEDKGNPSTAVWVDLQTGLYYCPNADPYGKTPKGKYTSQRDAQLDQFAPAYRKVCD